jgi:hypothetical protein
MDIANQNIDIGFASDYVSYVAYTYNHFSNWLFCLIVVLSMAKGLSLVHIFTLRIASAKPVQVNIFRHAAINEYYAITTLPLQWFLTPARLYAYQPLLQIAQIPDVLSKEGAVLGKLHEQYRSPNNLPVTVIAAWAVWKSQLPASHYHCCMSSIEGPTTCQSLSLLHEQYRSPNNLPVTVIAAWAV